MSDPVPAKPSSPQSSDEIDLFELVEKIWEGKVWVIGCAALFGLLGSLNAFLTTPQFESKAVLAPVKKGGGSSAGASALLSQLGPIAGIAGVSAPAEVSSATLKSVQFAEDFIVKYDLMPLLYPEAWDLEQKRWRSGNPQEIPDIRDAVSWFSESILSVQEDLGFVNVTVTWHDPIIAQDWAAKLVEFANDTLRQKALADAERNMAYLQAQIPLTNSVTVQQSIGRLLDQEMQTVMFAKGNPEFAFTVIDPPKVPKYKSSPKRAQMIVLSTLAGVLVGLLALLFRSAIRARRARAEA
jgi:uncharacterized protein involved in exopolysaccharide biosynthesis